MKWVWIIGGGLVALIAIVILVGTLLPRDHVASLTARIAATPDAVWQAVTNLEGQTAWRTGLQRVEVLPSVDGKPAWREHLKDMALTMVIDEAQPPRRLVTRIADTNLPFGGAWEYDIQPDGAGSRVTITERGSVYNPVFRFVSRFIMGHTATIDRYLRDLGGKFGETPRPTSVARGGE
jgi:uncharacterized protein YndB with AHSA1/START domain